MSEAEPETVAPVPGSSSYSPGSRAASKRRSAVVGDRRLSKNLLTLLVTMLVFVLAAEALLHAVPQLRPVPRTYIGEYPNKPRRAFIIDPLIGWRFKPFLLVDHPTHYRLNSLGFRSNVEFDPSPQVPKIALVGESHSFGLGVQYEETFGQMLESRLHGVPVYNLAIPGFALDQMGLDLEHYALPLHPRLAVIVFNSGDFTGSEEAYRTSEGLNKSVYKLVGGQLVAETVQDRPNALVEFLDRHSSLWRAERLVSRTLAHRFPVTNWWRLNEAILDRMRALGDRQNVPLLFVYLPTRDESTRFTTLRSYMERTHANFIDMSEGERRLANNTTLPDGHPNSLGHRYVAEAIAGWISEHMPEGFR